MASPVGAQYVFFEPDSTEVRLALTREASNLPALAAGTGNIEVFTTSPGSPEFGPRGSAFAPGAVVDHATILGAAGLELLTGDYAVAGGNSIRLGSGNQSVIGAAGATVTGGSGSGFIDASAGAITVQIGSAGGSDNVFSGHFDTVRGGADAATVLGAAADMIDLAGSTGTAVINAMAGHESVTLGSGAATVFGGMSDTIDLGSSSNAFVNAERGGMSILLGSSGADTIYARSNSSDPNSGMGGDTIIAAAAGTASANVILARGDNIDLTGGVGNATINALAGNDTVPLGGLPATVFGGMGDTIDLGSSSNAFVNAERGGMSIRLGSSGADSIYARSNSSDPNSGMGGDTIIAAAAGTASANVILARGDNIDLTGGVGNATINALAGNDTVPLGGLPATVFGGMGDTIDLGSSSNAFVNAERGGMSI